MPTRKDQGAGCPRPLHVRECFGRIDSPICLPVWKNADANAAASAAANAADAVAYVAYVAYVIGGVWCVVCGLWCVVCVVCVVCGVWCVWCVVCGVWCVWCVCNISGKSWPQGFNTTPRTLNGEPCAPKVHPSGHKGHAMKPPVPQRGGPGHPRVPKGPPRMSTTPHKNFKTGVLEAPWGTRGTPGGTSKKQQAKSTFSFVNNTIQEAKWQYYAVNSSIQTS